MTVPVHSEGAFEAAIEAHLVADGWVSGSSGDYRRDLGLAPTVLFEFLRASQPKAWTSLVRVHGSEALAEAKFVKRLTAEIDARGTLDVLRRGVEDNGVKVRLAFFKPGHALTPNLMALYDANLLVVIRQAHAMESNPQDSVDLLFLINGLPVATAELKNELTNQNVEDAKKQYRRDRNPHDLVFAKRTVVHFAVDPNLVFLTTRLAGEDTYFLPFNQGSGGPGKPGGKGNPPTSTGYRAAYLWKQVWQRDNWLDLFGRFIHEEKPIAKKGKKTAARGKVIFPRYHQWHAVLQLAGHAATYGAGRNYLPQHSAGSGKSNTIAWLAHRLSTLHTPADVAELTDHARDTGLGANERIFHKIIVVTDRVVLDRQLQDTIFQFDHTPGLVERIDKNSKQLTAALSGSRAQIIVTTLQKFPVIAKAATDLGDKRFAVIVDEAHSSQSGESAKGLKAVLGTQPEVANRLADELSRDEITDALWDAAEEFDRALEEAGDPEDAFAAIVESLRKSAAIRGKQDNLSFFAFTATPKHKTLQLFGEHVVDLAFEGGVRLEPFHLYSMRQAIEEGFILDVLADYVTYKTYFRLANGLGAEDPEVDKGKANAALARFVALHPSNLAQKAEIIVEHFRTVTRHQINGEAKAMVVTRSRLHAVRYKQAIEAYIAENRYTDLRALVAFSGKVVDPDGSGVEYTESRMNTTPDGKPIPETETAKRFKGDEDNGFPVGDYQVLIVAEKYQTGFDEPRLHTMYVDKKLEGVKAVQTLSRLNRTMPGKNSTFVLDFANDAEDIANAFKPFYEQSWTEPTDPNVLFNLRTRILAAGVIDPTEMRTLVAALLTSDARHHESLYAQTDNAVVRYQAIEDSEDREDFRTALRDFVRTYAFLGQVVPFASADLEELYYYGRILITRLPKDDTDDGGDIDLGTAAVLTHIRTEKQAEQNVTLAEGDGVPVRGMQGGGRGAQHLPEKVRLSSLIDVLNDKFGMSLTQSDQIWFDQQVEVAVRDEDLREVASANTEENFAFEFDRRFADVIEQRHSLNDDLFRMFFDKPEFQEALTAWARREVYQRIQSELGDVA
ncbi:type I restriction endonuclease subunit R [Geodermatophilus sp. SYSU D01106]